MHLYIYALGYYAYIVDVHTCTCIYTAVYVVRVRLSSIFDSASAVTFFFSRRVEIFRTVVTVMINDYIFT